MLKFFNKTVLAAVISMFPAFGILNAAEPQTTFNPGVIDTSFVGDTPISALGGALFPNFEIRDIRILDDNSKLIAGVVRDLINNKTFGIILKLQREGKLDSSFGGVNGFFPGATGVSTSDSTEINKIALTTDGKFMAVGTDHESKPMLIRFLPTGWVDKSFNQGAPVSYQADAADTWPVQEGVFTSVEADAFGRIYAGGRVKILPGSFVSEFSFIARYDSAGNPDFEFIKNGMVTPQSIVKSIQLRNDRLFFMVQGKNGASWLSCKNAVDGSDAAFGPQGHVELPPNVEINDLISDSNGKILLAGSLKDAQGVPQGLVFRFDLQGNLDPSFGQQGFVTFLVGKASAATGIATDAYGNIIVIGAAFHDAGSTSAVLGRFTHEGEPDVRFGGYDAGPGGASFKVLPKYNYLSSIRMEFNNDNIVVGGVAYGDSKLSGFAMRLLGGNDPIIIPTNNGEKSDSHGDSPASPKTAPGEGNGPSEAAGASQGGCNLNSAASGNFAWLQFLLLGGIFPILVRFRRGK